MPGDLLGKGLGVVVGGLLGGSDSQGATQTASKEPWAAAAPWIKGLISQGQTLQDQYTANPLSLAQKNAYANMANQGDYVRSQIPQLLNTVNSQTYFNRGNPSARPAQYQFTNAGGALFQQTPMSSGNSASALLSPFMASPAPAAAPAAPAMSQDYMDLLNQYKQMQQNALLLSSEA